MQPAQVRFGFSGPFPSALAGCNAVVVETPPGGLMMTEQRCRDEHWADVISDRRVSGPVDHSHDACPRLPTTRPTAYQRPTTVAAER